MLGDNFATVFKITFIHVVLVLSSSAFFDIADNDYTVPHLPHPPFFCSGMGAFAAIVEAYPRKISSAVRRVGDFASNSSKCGICT